MHSQHKKSQRGEQGEPISPRCAEQKNKHQRHDHTVPQHVAQVVTHRVPKAEKATVNQPGQIAHKQRFFAGEMIRENRPQSG